MQSSSPSQPLNPPRTSDLPLKPSGPEALSGLSQGDLLQLRVEFIRLTWVDFTNTIRYRILPLTYFNKLISTERGSVSLATASLGLVYVSLAEGFNATGDQLLVADTLSGIRFCPYDPRHASVMCTIEERAPVTTPDKTFTTDSPLCPRTTLKRVVREAKEMSGVEFLVGFESEFVLLKNDDPVEPVGTFQFSSSAALRTGTQATMAMEEMARSVIVCGIDLQMYHAEGGPGQYEIVTGPMSPLKAVDGLIMTREIIYNVAAKHGLRATFAPRVFPHGLGTGAHAHISVHSIRDKNIKSEKGLDHFESTFLAGVLEHLPSLAALTLPIPPSYKRVGDGAWSGGTYVCWGTDNRECPIRLTSPTSPKSRRFEMRFIDGTANPYLALAGIIGAGARALREGYELKVSDCRGPITAAQMSEDERRALGITKRMPLTWEEARNNLGSDDVMKGILGAETVEKFLAVNKVLGEALEAGGDKSAKLKRLIEMY